MTQDPIIIRSALLALFLLSNVATFAIGIAVEGVRQRRLLNRFKHMADKARLIGFSPRRFTFSDN